MKLHEYQEMVRLEREAQRLTNLENIAKIVSTKNDKKGQN